MSQPLLLRLLVCLALARTDAVAQDAHSIRTLRGHERWVLSLAVAPDSKSLASGSDDQTLKIWEIESGATRTVRKFASAVTALAFSRDGRRLAVGTWDGELMLCDPRTGEIPLRLSEHTELITTVIFDRSGDYIASGSADDRLVIWDASSGDPLLTIAPGQRVRRHHRRLQPRRQPHRDGRWGKTSSRYGTPRTARKSKPSPGTRRSSPRPPSAPTDGRSHRRAGDGTVRLWSSESGMELRALRGHDGEVNAVLFEPSGARLVSASEDRSLRIWDTKTGRLVARCVGHKDSVSSVAISPNGKWILSGSKKEIRVWKLGGTPSPSRDAPAAAERRKEHECDS